MTSSNSSLVSSVATSSASTPLSSLSSVISLPSSIKSQAFASKIVHALDLPTIQSKPSANDLLELLSLYSRGVSKNFAADEDKLLAPEGFVDWLTRLVGSGLYWIEDDDEREQVFDSASRRISERCGRTAAPSMERAFDIDGLSASVVLHEPSLTSDALGLKTWGSSLLLAKRLSKFHTTIISRNTHRVLELGSGTGLVGIVLGILGYRVLMSDLPEILPNLGTNIKHNELEFGKLDIDVEELDWNLPESSLAFKRNEKFDTVILSDPIYSLSHPPMIANVLKTIFDFQSPFSRVIIQLPLRANYSDVRAEFWKCLQAIGLKPCESLTEEGRDDFGEEIFLFSMWRPEAYVSDLSIDIHLEKNQ
ncbi:putative methyltransferase-domain-containing protein [Lipomyces japonicus]|uniref:putative methyltransferase-domain-containing protein n=1 Tax=Lipomyces japonicus TaxID=56871 RepID=UPI0034CDC0F9